MAPPKKGNAFLSLLSSLWGLVKFVLFIVLVGVAFMELTTPSLDYTTAAPKPYRSAQPAGWIEPTDTRPERAYRTVITTNDYRQLEVEIFGPPTLKDNLIPITVIVAGFATPEWLIEKVRPRGHNAVVVYRSPRIKRMTGPALPTALMARYAQNFKDYWNIIGTNPFNYTYSIHAGLHEAPGDIVDIVKWSVENVMADPNRVNIVGIGSGSLIAAAAASGLQVSGVPARTLAMVFPPANLNSAINDNLTGWPKFMRTPVAKLLEVTYYRLWLKRHLPNIHTASKLVVIPQDCFELATYAAEPAIALAGARTTTKYLNLGFNPVFSDANIAATRDIVGSWLVDQGGISGY